MGSLFGAKPKPPPEIQPPAVMPTPDDLEIQRAKKRATAEMVQRSGRMSTVLSDPTEKLGG